MAGIYNLAILGGNFLSKLKNGKEFEGGLHEKRKGKEEKSDKTHVKIPL